MRRPDLSYRSPTARAEDLVTGRQTQRRQWSPCSAAQLPVPIALAAQKRPVHEYPAKGCTHERPSYKRLAQERAFLLRALEQLGMAWTLTGISQERVWLKVEVFMGGLDRA